MVKVRTETLIGAKLDYAVAKAEGVEFLREWPKFDYTPDYVGYVLGDDGRIVSWHFDGQCSRAGHWKEEDVYSPSTDWSQGGPIIEREELELEPVRKDKVNGIGNVTGWHATHPKNYGGLIRFYGYGETPLVAAMRCYVASKLGSEVEIPDELLAA